MNLLRTILMMSLTVLSAALVGCAGMSKSEPSLAQLDMKMGSAVVELTREGSGSCTGWRLEPGVFATAAHCSRADGIKFGETIVPILARFVDPNGADFMVMFAHADPGGVSLDVDCSYTPLRGDDVVYMGFPGTGGKTLTQGWISGILPDDSIRRQGGNQDFTVMPSTAPGGSGSPILLRRTGKVIGLLIEGQVVRGVGAWAIGVEDIRQTSLCLDPK